MTTNEIINKWGILANQAGPSDRLRIFPDHTLDFYLSLSADKSFELYVFCKSPFDVKNLNFNLKNIKISFESIVQGTTVCLSLGNKDLLGSFGCMCCDIARQSDNSISTELSFERLVQAIEKWHELLKRKFEGEMTRSNAIGLWGELAVLSDLLKIQNLDNATLVNSWRGPNGDQTDISYKQNRVEIKTQLSTKALSLRITSLEQLENSREKLCVCLNRITPSPGGRSLLDLIDDILRMIGIHSDLCRNFEDKIEVSTFVAQSKHALEKFELSRRILYRVNDEFPRLFRGNVPSGIVAAEYTIQGTSIVSYEYEWSDLLGELCV